MRLLRKAGWLLSVFLLRAAHYARYVILHIFSEHKRVHGVRVIVDLKGRILLVKHWYAPWVWTLPGGLVEAHENDEVAAVREVEEETGFRIIRLEGEVGTYQGSLGQDDMVRVLYTTQFEGGIKLMPDFEIMQRGLFYVHELPEELSPANRARILAYARGVRNEKGYWHESVAQN